MPKLPPTLLGISLGTRRIGIAVMKENILLDWRIHSFKDSWSRSKQKDILFVIAGYIEECKVTEISIKKLDPIRNSEPLQNLFSEITMCANRKNIVMKSYSLLQMKKYFSKERTFTKSEMIKQVALQFPELIPEYNRDQKNKTPYYIKIFEAVLVVNMANKKVK